MAPGTGTDPLRAGAVENVDDVSDDTGQWMAVAYANGEEERYTQILRTQELSPDSAKSLARTDRCVTIADPRAPVVLQASWTFDPGKHQLVLVGYEDRLGQLVTARLDRDWPDPDDAEAAKTAKAPENRIASLAIGNGVTRGSIERWSGTFASSSHVSSGIERMMSAACASRTVRRSYSRTPRAQSPNECLTCGARWACCCPRPNVNPNVKFTCVVVWSNRSSTIAPSSRRRPIRPSAPKPRTPPAT